jgi:hypothetical protein
MSSNPKRLPPAFEMKFKRPGISPEEIPLGILSRALAALQRLAIGDAAGADEEETDHEPDALIIPEGFGLVGVRRGSAIYQVATRKPELAIARLSQTGSVLENPESIGDGEFMLGPLYELSAVSRSLESAIILKRPGKGGDVLAVIGPNSYSRVSDSLFVEGDTTLFGRVERVGGATSTKCGLRLSHRTRMLFCSVEGDELARELGQKLYQNVAAHGTAQWMKTTWKVIRFSIREISQPKMKPFSKMIDDLRNAGGSDWDKIADPEAFLGEVAG